MKARKIRSGTHRKPTVIEVIALICPKVNVVFGKFATYDVETKTIEVPFRNDRSLRRLIEAVHEAFHALRHRQGHPFYKFLESSKISFEGLFKVKKEEVKKTNRIKWNEKISRIKWNEEAIEESRVTECTEKWCLENLDFPKEKITAIITEVRKEALKPDEGYVSKYQADCGETKI